jgi:sec-independent protein translocase protein TatC
MAGEQDPKGDGVSTPEDTTVSYQQTVDDPYGYGYDPYASTDPVRAEPPAAPVAAAVAPPAPPPPPPVSDDDDEDDDDGMLRMSFLEHLEELRSRLIKIVAGLGVCFVGSLAFATQLWNAVRQPAADALRQLGFEPELAQLTPMDGFMTIYVKLPLLAAVFLASPWILWQIWAFIAPGLYKKERKWAGPFVIVSAGLFIAGGCFAYFVAFRFGLQFLLGVGKDVGVKPVVSLVEYFDLFVNVTLGIGLLFEMPVLIFFLTLLRITTPGFLIRNARYAILAITILAAVVTPTPDVVNLTLFAVPMILLFFVGVFGGWILTLHRAGRGKLATFYTIGALTVLLALTAVGTLVFGFGYRFAGQWPFLVK